MSTPLFHVLCCLFSLSPIVIISGMSRLVFFIFDSLRTYKYIFVFVLACFVFLFSVVSYLYKALRFDLRRRYYMKMINSIVEKNKKVNLFIYIYISRLLYIYVLFLCYLLFIHRWYLDRATTTIITITTKRYIWNYALLFLLLEKKTLITIQ